MSNRLQYILIVHQVQKQIKQKELLEMIQCHSCCSFFASAFVALADQMQCTAKRVNKFSKNIRMIDLQQMNNNFRKSSFGILLPGWRDLQ